MNISLSAAAASKKKNKPLGFGLNARSSGGGTNAFDDDDEESDKDPTAAPSSDARAVVNQALRKEQDALRQRAQKELQQASAAAADIYDYDAAYESFQPDEDKTKNNNDDNNNGAKPKESRYIAKLLQTAQERQLDRDIAYERKVAREQQQEEEADVALRGKERFVTASYKRKLEERKLWQDKRAKDDDGGDGNPKEMANFYGNLTHNVAMGGGGGGGGAEQEGASKEEPDGKKKPSAAKEGMGFLDGFAKGNDDDENKSNNDNNDKEPPVTPTNSKRSASPPIDPETRRQQERQKRQDKVAQARIRYLQRHGIQAN